MPPRLTANQINQAITRYANKRNIASTLVRANSKLRAAALQEYMDWKAETGTKPRRMVCKK